MLFSMPYMFCRKWVVLRDKKYTQKEYNRKNNEIVTVSKEILYTDKLIASSWSSIMAIYSFPLYMIIDIRRFEAKTRNIDYEENRLTNFMDILIE